MKTRKFLVSEAANIICWFRILASLALCFLPRGGWACALLYSLAFLSDLWDGWFYRHCPYTHPNHWFNRLPLTMDPLADFMFVAGGFIHVAPNRLTGLAIFGVVALILIIWHTITHFVANRVYAVMMTFLTYYWFAMMALALGLVWFFNCQKFWYLGFAIVMVVFYATYFKLEDKSRRIRKRG